jgi:methylation protein EvaC
MKSGHCAVCGASIKPFISFGRQPIANGFLTQDEIAKEYFFDLQVAFCSSCSMVQLTEQPDREQMFNENYAFFTGTSKYMAIHFAEFAQQLRKDYIKSADPFVVEIGSNDGTMLKNFADAGVRHCGVEPSANVAAVASERGVTTLNRFFDRETAETLLKKSGAADAMLAEGSTPQWRTPASAKFLSIVPSLLPISTTKGSADLM